MKEGQSKQAMHLNKPHKPHQCALHEALQVVVCPTQYLLCRPPPFLSITSKQP